jgi:hypothetical protein|tara:strand:- start:2423 stop:2536 length:114 start_codon:yes stop_codon:yes gene_type:complete
MAAAPPKKRGANPATTSPQKKKEYAKFRGMVTAQNMP